MSCPFYGKAARVADRGHGRVDFPLIDTGGNQCAIIVDSHAPCVMEQRGYPVDGKDCDLLRVASSLRVSLARNAERERGSS